MVEWKVRPVMPGDEESWRVLYRGYRNFYNMPVDDSKVDVVWGWILDAHHEVQGFVAEGSDGELKGFANVRLFARPLSASVGLFLDDLFTREEARGEGVGRSLLAYLKGYADEHELSVVRWITAESNASARELYDSVATATPWVTYDMS